MAESLVKTRMTYNRDTKGTYVYVNDTDGAPIPTLYIKKDAFAGDPPEKIRIVITERES